MRTRSRHSPKREPHGGWKRQARGSQPLLRCESESALGLRRFERTLTLEHERWKSHTQVRAIEVRFTRLARGRDLYLHRQSILPGRGLLSQIGNRLRALR